MLYLLQENGTLTIAFNQSQFLLDTINKIEAINSIELQQFADLSKMM